MVVQIRLREGIGTERGARAGAETLRCITVHPVESFVSCFVVATLRLLLARDGPSIKNILNTVCSMSILSSRGGGEGVLGSINKIISATLLSWLWVLSFVAAVVVVGAAVVYVCAGAIF